MSTVLKWLLALLLTVPLALLGRLLARDPGRLSLQGWGWQIDTTLVLALVLLMLGGAALFGLYLLIWRLPIWLVERRRARLVEQFRAGMIDLAYARPAKATRKLLNASALSDYAPLALLGAAYAAEQVGDLEQAQQLWTRLKSFPEFAQVAATYSAKFKIARNDATGLSELTQLAQIEPSPLVLRVLVDALKSRGRAIEALGWFPQLLSQKSGERNALAQDWSELTKLSLAQASTATQLSELWQQIGKTEKVLPELLAAYAAAALRLGQSDLAEQALLAELERAPSEQLYAAFAHLPSSTTNSSRIKTAERWLAARGETPALLFALGKLCGYEALWGKSHSYLERSLEMGATAEVWEALAELSSAHGDSAAACVAYRNALAVARGTLPEALVLKLPRAQLAAPELEPRGAFGFPLA